MPWALRTGQRPKHSWRDSGIGQYHWKITVSENDTGKFIPLNLGVRTQVTPHKNRIKGLKMLNRKFKNFALVSQT